LKFRDERIPTLEEFAEAVQRDGLAATRFTSTGWPCPASAAENDQPRARGRRKCTEVHKAISLSRAVACSRRVTIRLSGLRSELQDPIVAVARTFPAVAVAGGEPQSAVWCGNDGSQTPVLSDKQRCGLAE
jgi:hypothetical protein